MTATRRPCSSRSCSTRVSTKVDLIPYNPTGSAYEGYLSQRDRRVQGRAGGDSGCAPPSASPAARHRRGLRLTRGYGAGRPDRRAARPSRLPEASSARTATNGRAGTVTLVSKPVLGAEPTTARPVALAPASSSQRATPVAPFQLALTVALPVLGRRRHLRGRGRGARPREAVGAVGVVAGDPAVEDELTSRVNSLK